MTTATPATTAAEIATAGPGVVDRRLPGLDYGRAFFALAVVAWHSLAFGDAAVLRRPAGFDLAGVVDVNVLLLAVPFFLTTALFLYARSWTPDAGRLAVRLRTLVVLIVFWTALTWMTRGIGSVRAAEVPAFVLTGGFTVYYFLVALVWLTLLVELGMRLGLRTRVRALAALTVAGIILMVLRQPIAAAVGASYVLPYWSPIGFLVYAPAAMLLAAVEDRVSVRALLAGGAAYVLLAIVEWLTMLGAQVGPAEPFMPSYARPSVVVGAFVVVAALTRCRAPAPRWIVALSGLSLGIYVVHRFLLDNFEAIWPSLYGRLDHAPFVIFLLVTAGSIAVAWAGRTQRVL